MMGKKRRVKKMNGIITKPVEPTKINFKSKGEFNRFAEYAFGTIESSSKTEEIKKMIENHKKGRKMDWLISNP